MQIETRRCLEDPTCVDLFIDGQLTIVGETHLLIGNVIASLRGQSNTDEYTEADEIAEAIRVCSKEPGLTYQRSEI